MTLEFESDNLNAMQPIDWFRLVKPGVAIPMSEDGDLVLLKHHALGHHHWHGHPSLVSAFEQPGRMY